MTKEQIYESATLKGIGNNPTGTRMDIVYSAMDEWAKQQAIAFAEWIVNHELDFQPTMKKGTFIGLDLVEYSSHDLYKNFLTTLD